MHTDVPNDLQAGLQYATLSVFSASLLEGCRLTITSDRAKTVRDGGDSPIFLDLMSDHLKRLTYREMAVRAEKRMTAFRPAFLRSSCSGSAAQFRNVTTSFAIWEVVAGVPKGHKW